MKFNQLASRVAVGGVSAALATAGLVGATTATASAAPVSTSYTCSIPTIGDRTVTVSVDVAIPPTAPAGLGVPAGLLSFNSTLTVPSDVASTLSGFGINGARSGDFSTAFGTAVAKAPVVWNTPGAPTADGVPFTGKGANAAFQLPAAGTYAVTMPKSFTLTPTINGADFPATAPCAAAAPAQLGTIVLSKQNSTTKAKAPKSAKAGSPVSVKVKVTDDYSKKGGVIPSGKLLVKDGKKTVGKGKLKNGKAKLKVSGLAKGKHSLTVIYKGDKYNQGSKSKALGVKVS